MDRSTVAITLGGEIRELKCTLEAMTVMNKAYGGMLNMYQRVKDVDFEAMLVAVGCGLMLEGEEAKKLPDLVYKSGMIDLSVPVGEFVLLCASGGIRQYESLTEGGESLTEVGT